MLASIDYYFFSPTGGTKKAGELFCKGIAERVNYIDLTTPKDIISQPQSDVVIFAAPVYAGRIPAIAAERFSKINGHGKKAVTFVVYGVRAYDDALLELNDLVNSLGFEIVASGALIAQHSVVKEIGAGRPDTNDEFAIHSFGREVLRKLNSHVQKAVEVPGNRPYRTGMNLPVSPISLPNCSGCGFCTFVCPTKAIQKTTNGLNTNTDSCILCMACVARCPRKARALPTELQESMNQKLLSFKDSYVENQFFL